MIVYVGKKHKYVHIDYWDTWSMDITLSGLFWVDYVATFVFIFWIPTAL